MEDMNKHQSHDMVESKSSYVEYLKFALVVLFIILSSILLQKRYGVAGAQDYLRWLMGTTFMVFGAFKCVGYKFFVAMFPMYDLLAKRKVLYAYMYPFIELFFAIVYWFNYFNVYRDIAALVITVFGAVGIYKNIKSQGKIKCACLGNIIKLPLSSVSLFENLAMAAMALAMLII